MSRSFCLLQELISPNRNLSFELCLCLKNMLRQKWKKTLFLFLSMQDQKRNNTAVINQRLITIHTSTDNLCTEEVYMGLTIILIHAKSLALLTLVSSRVLQPPFGFNNSHTDSSFQHCLLMTIKLLSDLLVTQFDTTAKQYSVYLIITVYLTTPWKPLQNKIKQYYNV